MQSLEFNLSPPFILIFPGYDLLDLCLNGPLEKLDRTEYCQPAVVVTSLAAAERLRTQNEEALEACVGAAGLSVGEITALIFAGAISFEDGIRIVKVKGQGEDFMQALWSKI